MYQERLDLTKSDADSAMFPNCRGFAFYVSGIIEKYGFVDSDEGNALFDGLERIAEPRIHCLIAFRSSELIHHMGIVTRTDPLTLLHLYEDEVSETTEVEELKNEYAPNIEFRVT